MTRLRTLEILDRSTWRKAQFSELKVGDVARLREPSGELATDRFWTDKDGKRYAEVRDWAVTAINPPAPESPDAAGYAFEGEPHDFDRDDIFESFERAISPWSAVDYITQKLVGPLAAVAREALKRGDAPNFLSFRVVRHENDEEPLEVVIRRASGLTPMARFTEAQKRVDELLTKNNEYQEDARAARRAQRAAELTRDTLAEKMEEIGRFVDDACLECGAASEAEERYKNTIESIALAFPMESSTFRDSADRLAEQFAEGPALVAPEDIPAVTEAVLALLPSRPTLLGAEAPEPWGVEETPTTLWVGPLRGDGSGKVARAVCSVSVEGLAPEALERARADARRLASGPGAA